MESYVRQDEEEDQNWDGWMTCPWTWERWVSADGGTEQGTEKLGRRVVEEAKAHLRL
jgi:hypothetical protein